MALNAIVVVPAHDEEARIADCLRALAAQTVPRREFETIVVLDDCGDGTAAVVERVSDAFGIAVTTIIGPGRGAGAARRAGMDLACRRLMTADRPRGLIASTDADSRPARDWLERQLAHVEAGARAIAGLIELDDEEARELPPGVHERREREAGLRLRRVRRSEPEAGHHHFAGASLGITAATYRDVGGIEPLAALEDAEFGVRLSAQGVQILRAADVRVQTSARSDGRVARGLSVDLAVSAWMERRRYEASAFTVDALRAAKRETRVCVVIPTKRCAETIGPILDLTVAPLQRGGVVDELLVVDADAGDGTAQAAAARGARVIGQDDIRPELGPALGKGDAMWRALQVTGGDIVAFLDGDTADPHVNHLIGLLGPLLTDPSLQLVKGAFDRPLRTGEVSLPHEGGRVTELMARPLLNLHEPLLAGFAQPLAGEFAARRAMLEAVPVPAGYGVEIAVLIDLLRLAGLDALAECHLGSRQNRHQPLRTLGEMSYAVLAALENRLARGGMRPGGHYLKPWEDGATSIVPVLERPPIRVAAAEGRHRSPAPA